MKKIAMTSSILMFCVIGRAAEPNVVVEKNGRATRIEFCNKITNISNNLAGKPLYVWVNNTNELSSSSTLSDSDIRRPKRFEKLALVRIDHNHREFKPLNEIECHVLQEFLAEDGTKYFVHYSLSRLNDLSDFLYSVYLADPLDGKEKGFLSISGG